MPRKITRFSKLKKQMRSSGGVAKAGSALANFIQFQAGERSPNKGTRPSQEFLRRLYRGVVPFTLSSPASGNLTNFALNTGVTLWSDKGRVQFLGLSDTEMNYVQTAREDDLFYPSVLRVKVVSTNAIGISPISGITGKEYKTVKGVSFSIPFGRSVSLATAGGMTGSDLNAATESVVRLGLVNKMVMASGSRRASVSYLPEEFKSQGQSIGKEAAPA